MNNNLVVCTYKFRYVIYRLQATVNTNLKLLLYFIITFSVRNISVYIWKRLLILYFKIRLQNCIDPCLFCYPVYPVYAVYLFIARWNFIIIRKLYIGRIPAMTLFKLHNFIYISKIK